MAELYKLHEAIVAGKLNDAVAVTNEAVAEGVDPNDLVNNYMIKAMEEIGAKFEAGQA
ncbi:MAG: cobalamin-binding protein, partial [Bacteroidales bacterium]|nr:cobalamin-binding protein [Bacteroidales bacterium]